MAAEWSGVLIARAQFQQYVAEQHQSLRKLQALERKYSSSWACWGNARDVGELLALSRANMLRTNSISADLMMVVPQEARTRLGTGESAYFEMAQSWSTRGLPEGTAAVVRDLELWKAPVAEGVRRACTVIGPRDPVRWTRRVGLMNHSVLIDGWLGQLDTTGGMGGSALCHLSAFIREFYIGAVASVSTYMNQLAPGCGEHKLQSRPSVEGRLIQGERPYASA